MASIISKNFTNSLIVFAVRPPCIAIGDKTFSTSYRKQLRAIKRHDNTEIAVIESLAPLHTEELACRLLKVKNIH